MRLGLGIGLCHRRLGGGTPPAPAAPNITSSSITGTPQDGQTLTAQRTVTGYPSPTITYQWQKNGANIAGQTAQTIVLNAATMALANGNTISCEITATNASGSDSEEPTIAFVVPADVTAPTLSSPTDTANGSTAMTGTVSTNEANGTLYRYISTSATPPSASNLKAGTGAVASGSQAVNTTGVQNVSSSGLTASTTYYTHYLHRDAAGNDSAIVSADGFTTDAAAPSPTAPALTQTSPTGTNPMAWESDYTAMIPDSDVIRQRWRVNGGSWNYSIDHLFTSADFYDSEDGTLVIEWPEYDAASFAAGALVEVQEGVLRDGVTAWSNTISDTMAAVLWQPLYDQGLYNQGFSSLYGDFPNHSYPAGTSVFAVAHSHALVGLSIPGGVFTFIGRSNASGGGVSLYRMTAASPITNQTLRIEMVSGYSDVSVASAALSSAIQATPSSTGSTGNGFNPDPQILPALSETAGGVSIAAIGLSLNAGSVTWNNGIASADERKPADDGFSLSTGYRLPTSTASVSFSVNGANYSGAGGVVAHFPPV